MLAAALEWSRAKQKRGTCRDNGGEKEVRG